VRSAGAKNYNERTLWYRGNLVVIKTLYKYTLALSVILFLYLLFNRWDALRWFTVFQWLIIFTFPLLAALYTFRIPVFYYKKIRQIGWLKPFIVGFTWSGWVTVYPLLALQIDEADGRQTPVLPATLFWLQNFIFISILAIIFDIKDYRTDVHFNLNTYPAKLGITNTFRYVIFPATILNIVVFILFQVQGIFLPVQTLIQSVPYLLLIWIILTHREPGSVLYYLVAIDGLMFLKAISGIISISFF
jgi:4-hydroxybenzoate polyprenyltransferase